MENKNIDRYKIVSMYINNQTEENWDKLIDFIRSNKLGKKQTLTIPFTENDIQELQSGYEEVLELIDEIDNDDEELAKLQNAMEYYCSTWDKCEGYKHALRLTIKDQYQNHKDEQDPEDLEKLKAILK